MGSSRSKPARVTAVEKFLEQYAVYLTEQRGLQAATVACYLHVTRPFVTEFERGELIDFSNLDAAHVSDFMVRESRRLSIGYAKLHATVLRSLLRYLHIEGVTAWSLASAVPAVAGWRLTGLPRDVDAGTLRRVLRSCDRRTATGRRDYAALLLLSQLGLRRVEVARLELDDVDWRRGELFIRGKGGQGDRLPLPANVGEALVAFVRRGRPSTACRSLFPCMTAPHGPASPGVFNALVRQACRRAGVPVFGPHRLRHTAACQMLRRGIPLAEVALVLRHRSTLTTAIYAKVDRRTLGALARPWPRAASVSRSSLRRVARRWVRGEA